MSPYQKAKELVDRFQFENYIAYSEEQKSEIFYNGVKYPHALQFAYMTADELKKLCANNRQFEAAHFYSEVQLHITKMQTKLREE